MRDICERCGAAYVMRSEADYPIYLCGACGAGWLVTRDPQTAGDVSHGSGASIVGPYRYLLWRSWPGPRKRIGWVMLNPSTADGTEDDATIRRCVGYARRWGCGGIDVANLFAFRSTRPQALLEWPPDEVVGPVNDDYLRHLEPRMVVCAWGATVAKSPRLLARAAHVVRLLRESERELYFLHRTRSGQPAHPLRLPGNLLPKHWEAGDVIPEASWNMGCHEALRGLPGGAR